MNFRAYGTLLLVFTISVTTAQINLGNTGIYTAPGTSISFKGHISGNTSLSGEGVFIAIDSTLQLIDLTGHSVPSLVINNPQGVSLLSGIEINQSLHFSRGKLKTGPNKLILDETAYATGGSDSGFIETGIEGHVAKKLNQNLNDFELPLGNDQSYHPVFIRTSGTYLNASITMQALPAAPVSMPVSIRDHINNAWPFKKTGISGQVELKGQYKQTLDVTGQESRLKGYFHDGQEWTSALGSIDTVLHLAGSRVFADSGLIFAMNKHILLSAKAFLEGAYKEDEGMMEDALRTPVNYLPEQDPYRNALYSGYFLHVNNADTETVTNGVFSNQTDYRNDIVDWVFLQLRNTAASPGNQVLATRSALIQRDGDIVDMDGKSPVTFNDMPDGVYALTVRHRNHLSLSQNPQHSDTYLNESISNAIHGRLIDLTTINPNDLYGTRDSYSTAAYPLSGRVNLMKAGNANSNGDVRYMGTNSDRVTIFSDLEKNVINILYGYQRSDLNMDGMVKYSGLANDRAYLLDILQNNETTVYRDEIPQ